MDNQSLSTSVFRFQNHESELGAKIWTMTFDLPGESVNKFNQTVLEEIKGLLPKLQKMAESGEIDALVLVSGKPPGVFIAGADIEMIQAMDTKEKAQELALRGHQIFNEWEDLKFPKIIGVNGACLGGGLEISLASDAIVMSNDPSARVGLPEVMLGFIPGLGGCVRLPQRIGIANALDMILTGKAHPGKRAHRMGLADACLPKEDFEGNVLRWTRKNLSKLKKGERLAKKPKLGGVGGLMGGFLEGTPIGRALIFKKAREGVLKKTRGKYPAPLEGIDVIKAIGTGYGPKFKGRRRDSAQKREAQGFGKCAVTPISKNLIRIFYLTEAVKKSKGLSNGHDVEAFPIHAGAVLGAGTMGGGIAQLFADKDVQTRMKDINVEALETGIRAANDLFKKKLKRRRLTKRQHIQKLNHIAPVLDYSGFRSLDLVVEAIIEKMEIKKAVLKEVEGEVSKDCVIATNTSSLSVTEMQKALQHPERFVGMHFFNPVHRMPLIEVIRGEKTSDRATSAIYQFSKAIGKTPIVVGDGAGFLVNRLLVPYLNEAIYLLAEGAPIEEIDEALLDFGMPMGPMELIDEVGVDVGDKVLKILFDAFGERMTPAPLTGPVVQANRLGKKTGKGIYLYEGRKKVLDPEIYKLVGVKPKPGRFKKEEMIDRCVLPMINEASRCLDDGIVADAATVDLGMIMGTGFPPFRGGLLRYADSLGAKTVLEKLKQLEGPRFVPAPRIEEMASSAKAFHSDGG